MTGVLDPAFANTYVPPQGALAPAPAQGVMPPQAPPDYPNAAQINALMSQTSDQASAKFMQEHPVSSRLQMLAAAMGGGPTAMEQLRQTYAARQMEPLQVAQQLAQFGGIQALYQQLGAAGRTDLQHLLIVDPKSALKAVTDLITPTLTPQGQTLQAPGLGSSGSPAISMTAPQLNAPSAAIPTATTQTPAALVQTGAPAVQVTTTPAQKAGFIQPPGQGDGQQSSVPSSQGGTAQETTLTPEETQSRFPGQPFGTTAKTNLDGTTTLIPPPITEEAWNTRANSGYVNNDQHKDAVGRAQALSAVGGILSALPSGALSSQAVLNQFITSQTSRENPTRPGTIEQLLTRMGLPEQAFSTLTGLGSARGQQITTENIKNMYRSIYEETAPRVETDSKLLAPIVSDAQRYHFNATPYVGMHPQLPPVPPSMQDRRPINPRDGQTVWAGNGPWKWSAKQKQWVR